jgi:hypothetical protein
MRKTLSIVLVVVLVIAGAAWYFVAYRLDGVIKAQIETSASASLGTEVSVGSLKTSLKEGSLTISKITVANPPGYNNKNAFTLNGIDAAVDFENFDIKRVVIDAPEIVIEEKGGETNFSELLAGMEQSPDEPAASADGTQEAVITIRHFRMNESRAAFESESLNRYTDLEIDEVELNNLKGTPGQVASAIASEVMNEVVSEAAKEMLKAKAAEKMDSILGRDKD